MVHKSPPFGMVSITFGFSDLNLQFRAPLYVPQSFFSFSIKMNQEQEIPNQVDIVSVLSEIIRKFERYNSAVETKNM
jgi:hypothetical protein